ncbi:Kinase, CAMK CAMKL [Pelomyxa schiedti]|nr:Kinase, CAMK CAMKL [Pelomyxa schiedti]
MVDGQEYAFKNRARTIVTARGRRSVTIGSGPTCDFVLAYPSVSPIHATVTFCAPGSAVLICHSAVLLSCNGQVDLGRGTSHSVTFTFLDQDTDLLFNSSGVHVSNPILEDYSITTKPIGEGAYGTVFEGYTLTTREDVAIKKVCTAFREPGTMIPNLERELSILHMLNHKHVIRAIAYSYFPRDHLFLVLPRGHGDLRTFIEEHHPLSEADACHFFVQIASGLNCLHSNRIVHMDLKIENILVMENNLRAQVKIIDFGLSQIIEHGSTSVPWEFQEIPDYYAPEVRHNMRYHFASDIWKQDWKLPTVVELIQQLMDNDPKQRPTTAEILVKPWCQTANI